ncbi:MAG: hypothetical protein AAGI38_22835 [Bacteroidota bacterium]
MNQEQIQLLLQAPAADGSIPSRQLIETHISWVILEERFVYKIKKPELLSFLDFSTLSRRRYFCRREVLLNNRLTEGVYLYVAPVCLENGKVFFCRTAKESAEVIDYAVVMKRLDPTYHLKALLKEDVLTTEHMIPLAHKLASFHKETRVAKIPASISKLKNEFSDLMGFIPQLQQVGELAFAQTVQQAIVFSYQFLEAYAGLIDQRSRKGFVRDCHGDLHTGNIFLYPDKPIIFDCIEFNDEFREIDLLEEVAFLCMDLECAGREDLSAAFLEAYLLALPCIQHPSDHLLLNYYKLYRANIRCKVNLIQSQQQGRLTPGPELEAARKYAELMGRYLEVLEGSVQAQEM